MEEETGPEAWCKCWIRGETEGATGCIVGVSNTCRSKLSVSKSECELAFNVLSSELVCRRFSAVLDLVDRAKLS